MVLFDSLSLCCLGLSFIILSPRLQGMATVCVHFEFSVATILSFSEKHFSVGIFCSWTLARSLGLRRVFSSLRVKL
ncbi:predicted protein [Arabidopsis lyrata subsp. lyrata]|uniref:Predicted protein n=1 Tax=Arabidopsis lyrata subsp. lyrata TaxID=81972 RepID=D7LNW3_ARALL|nr:predicted protein [Arabidopsis lyrata subsp. lyrata]